MRSAALRIRQMPSTRISSRQRWCSKGSRRRQCDAVRRVRRFRKEAGSEIVVQRESYVHGNSGPPLIGKTIGALLDEVSATDGAREALVVAHQKIRWTYSELKSRSDAFASGLLSLGLEPGDRVGIWAPNCAEWTIAQFATAKAGLILVNINPAYRLGELEHVLRAVECRALITAARFKTSDYVAMI